MRACGGPRAAVLVLAALLGTPVLAAPVAGATLRVGVSGSAPFVIAGEAADGAGAEGISLDVWQEIAEAADLDYQLVPVESTDANVRAVADGELDVAIGPISITPQRLALPKLEFTQPYFYGQVGVLLPSRPPSLWSRIRPFFGVAALSSGAVLLLSLFVVGNLIWLAERGRNPGHFPRPYLRGLGNGMWFALVTLTTVGYGDRAPVTRFGRAVAGMWMVVALLAVSSITAGLASAFTVSLAGQRPEGIESASDLNGLPIAVVAGTTSERWGEAVGARVRTVASLEEGVALVEQRQVDGMIFDQPALKYYLRRQPGKELRVANFGLATETYGFALAEEAGLDRPLDIALLKLHRSGRIDAIARSWLE
jgi:polar amino acid transport system substrate-binding protein